MNRLAYRLTTRLGLLLASTFAIFALLDVAPGGPLAAYVRNPHLGTADIAGLDRDFGAGRPFYLEYFAWIFRVLHGDLGWSHESGVPVSRVIGEGLPATIELACVAFAVAVALGAIVAFARARTRAKMLRDVFVVPQLLCRAMPVAVLALLLQLFLVRSTSLPVAGVASVDAFDLGDRLAHLAGPVLSLAVPFGAWSSLIFYNLFHASENASRLTVRSALRAVAMTAALIGPALLAASLLIVEPTFAWPGVGRVIDRAFSQFDLGVLAGSLLTYSAGVVLLGLCAMPSPDTRVARRRTRFSAFSVVAIVVLFVGVLGAVAADLIAPVGPYLIDLVHWQGFPLPPGVGGHPLGTDENGRDLLSRLLIGLRFSLGIAAAATVIATAIAAVVARATRALPWFDERDALSVAGIRPFAALPFILAFVTVFVATDNSLRILNPLGMALIIGVVSWPAIVPAFRARSRATLGAVVDLAACALLLEVTLSMFGFGIQPATPSLGNLLANAQPNVAIAPWAVWIPTAVIVVVLSALYALGDDLRERGTERRSRRPADAEDRR